jgi:hypothetical protein
VFETKFFFEPKTNASQSSVSQTINVLRYGTLKSLWVEVNNPPQNRTPNFSIIQTALSDPLILSTQNDSISLVIVSSFEIVIVSGQRNQGIFPVICQGYSMLGT